MVSHSQPGLDVRAGGVGSTGPSLSGRVDRARVWRHHRVAGLVALGVAVLLGGVALVLAIEEALPVAGRVGALKAVSSVAAVVGTSLMLFLLLLITRWPVLERAFGQDRLVAWHRKIAPWSLWLIVAHVLLIVTANALEANASWLAGIGVVVRKNPGIVPAIAGLLAMAAAGLTSWRRLRGHLRHETWWTVHLLTYLGIVLAFFHQVVAGDTFSNGAARTFWVALYALVLGLIVWNRAVVPAVRSARHRLVVAGVDRESDDVVSVWMTGRNLARLRLQPGQFLNFRFRHRGLAYEAHPFSVSAADGDRLRITVKALGDASTALAGIPKGTRVTFEGPYGVMTPARAQGSRHVLVAGGVGIGPIVSLARGLTSDAAAVDVVYRASLPEDLVLVDDLRELETAGALRLHLLPGSRTLHPLSPEHLSSLLGDITDATVFVCGPESLNVRVTESARALGVPGSRIHSELFGL